MADSKGRFGQSKDQSNSADDRTNAIGLFHYAHSYWASASELEIRRVNATHPDAPIWFCYAHAIELFLKSYLRLNGASVAELKRIGHELTELGSAAKVKGLDLDANDESALGFLELEYPKLRYIQTGPFKRPSTTALWGLCSVLFDQIADQLIKSGRLKRIVERPLHPADAANDPTSEAGQ